MQHDTLRELSGALSKPFLESTTRCRVEALTGERCDWHKADYLGSVGCGWVGMEGMVRPKRVKVNPAHIVNSEHVDQAEPVECQRCRETPGFETRRRGGYEYPYPCLACCGGSTEQALAKRAEAQGDAAAL